MKSELRKNTVNVSTRLVLHVDSVIKYRLSKAASKSSKKKMRKKFIILMGIKLANCELKVIFYRRFWGGGWGGECAEIG